MWLMFRVFVWFSMRCSHLTAYWSEDLPKQWTSDREGSKWPSCQCFCLRWINSASGEGLYQTGGEIGQMGLSKNALATKISRSFGSYIFLFLASGALYLCLQMAIISFCPCDIFSVCVHWRNHIAVSVIKPRMTNRLLFSMFLSKIGNSSLPNFLVVHGDR